MTQLVRTIAGPSIGLGIALGLVACGSPFSAASGGGSDAQTTDVGTVDGPGAPGDASADGGLDAHDDGTIEASTDSGVRHADGGMAEGGMADGGMADGGGPCLGAFSAPTLVLQHTPQYLVDSITLTNDELDAFVTLFPVGATSEQRKVYAMHRASPAVAFVMDASNPLDLTNVGPTPGAFDVALSGDELKLYFSHRQDSDAGLLGVNIYVAQRATTHGTFAASSELGPGIDDPTTNQFHGHPAGLELYFTVATLTGGVQGNRDLYEALLPGSSRSPLVMLNGATTQEATPVPSRDELELFFSSDRANPGQNNLVYLARRSTAVLLFSPPNPVPLAIGGAGSSITPQHLTADRCRLYLLVDQQDAYVAQRAP